MRADDEHLVIAASLRLGDDRERVDLRGIDLEAQLDAHARAGLAGYKIPRLYVVTDQSLRLNNGKPDYKTAQALADTAG